MAVRSVLVIVLSLVVLLIAVDKFRHLPTGSRGMVTDTLAGEAPSAIPSAVRPAVRQLEPRLRQAQIAAIRQSAGQTYLDSLILGTDSLIRRWTDRGGRPLQVAMQPGGSPDYQPRFQALVRDAAALWEQQGLGFRFQFQADTAGAAIVVRWQTSFSPNDRAGQTDLVWDQYGRVRSAVITLAIRGPGDRKLSEEALLAVAVHELGHAVGLPHSSDPDDVMYPSTRTADISPRDRATAMLLYQLEPGYLGSDQR